METYIGAAEAARKLGATLPRRIGDVFTRGYLDASETKVISGVRMIPVSMLPAIRAELKKRGWLTLAAQATGVGNGK